MYYLVQSNIYTDPQHNQIFDILQELKLPYESIEVNGSTESIQVNTDREDIFLFGSVKLARLAKTNTAWTPGSLYGGNHNFAVHAPFYKHHLLNYESKVFRFGDTLNWQDGELKFIKPYQDAKVFTGKVFTETKWKDFVWESIIRPRTPMLNADTLIQISAPQTLVKEARLWIIGKKVIESVYYKFHGDTLFEEKVAADGIEFAKRMIQVFNVADAFVMDIGYTYNEWKIVEINCVNTAGFYHANAKAIIRALEAYF